MEWAITAVIVPFAVFQMVWLWPNKSVRLLSLAWALALLWAVEGVWDSQHWYEIAMAWKTAYFRDIGRVESQQPSEQYQYPLSTEFVYGDCRSLVRTSLPQLLGLSFLKNLRSSPQPSSPPGESCVLLEAVSEHLVAFQDPSPDTRQIWQRCHSLPEFCQLLVQSRSPKPNKRAFDLPYRSWPNTSR
jgi:hypothetical protein